MIPFVDLHAQYISIKSDIDNAIESCISDSNFIKGKAVTDFEKAFAGYLGSKFCVGCGNGTDALEIILKSLNIGHGDEVIVPALSWISTAEAVNNVGAEPVFADINEKTYTIDPGGIESKITKKTKAIIPVHLYGCPAEMNEIIGISEKYNIHVIEDSAQAHGAEYNDKKVGTYGIASAFSFFPSKNLGAYGDSGAIVTNDPALNEITRKISNHGQLLTKHEHSIIGRNSRLDSLQASILSAKLGYLDKWNLRRIKIAEFYKTRLGINPAIILPETLLNTKHVYHLFVIRCKRREDMLKLLNEKKISYSVHYPKPLPFLTAYKYKKHIPADFPVSCQITDEVLSLPMYPELTESQLNIICDQILENY
jgi:Predicted pyridoxal phosphate-dependent enzyme apparently involved in regulation of cell wall biogenesis